MKFAITGHTSGIGKAIVELCQTKGYQWMGFSRGTGYDIEKAEDCGRIVNESYDCDVFINNAYHEYVQVDLLYIVWVRWKNQRKQIVCISSVAGDIRYHAATPYSVHKAALDHACEQLQSASTIALKSASEECKVINIKPGYVDTPWHTGNNSINKLDPHHLANTILWCVEQPVNIQTIRISA